MSSVLGLSIASELVSQGLKVAMAARDLPEDVLSTQFASPWAVSPSSSLSDADAEWQGANWAFLAVTEGDRRRDATTFRRFAQLAKDHPDIFRRAETKYVWNKPGYQEAENSNVVFNVSLAFSSLYESPNAQFHKLTKEELVPGFKDGFGFETYTLNPVRYLDLLGSQLREAGVPIVRKTVSSLDEAYSLFGGVSLVINATGLGSRSLIGVEDSQVYPVRGQTVTVRAPGVTGVFGNKNPKEDPTEAVYTIPRPGPEEHVTLGGCNIPENWSTQPDLATARRILQQNFEICPALANGGKSWEDIEVVSHNVGLRPSRKGGIRLELEERTIGQGNNEDLIPRVGREGRGRKVGCVHAYGIGGAGYVSMAST